MTNVNSSTGISYGVINANEINGDVLERIMFGTNTVALDLLRARIDHIEKQNINFVLPVISLSESTNRFYNRVYEALDKCDYDWYDYDQSMEDVSNDVYSAIVDGCEVLYSTESNTVTVIDSPYTDKFARCSPCYPGAGDLNTRDNNGISTYTVPSDWKVSV